MGGHDLTSHRLFAWSINRLEQRRLRPSLRTFWPQLHLTHGRQRNRRTFSSRRYGSLCSHHSINIPHIASKTQATLVERADSSSVDAVTGMIIGGLTQKMRLLWGESIRRLTERRFACSTRVSTTGLRRTSLFGLCVSDLTVMDEPRLVEPYTRPSIGPAPQSHRAVHKDIA